MKSLLFSILILFFNTINTFAQERRIIFPEDKTISHEDSMGIILIDHIYNGRREKAVEMLKRGKVGGHVVDMNGFFAVDYAVLKCDTELITLLISKGAMIGEKGLVVSRVEPRWWQFRYWDNHFNYKETAEFSNASTIKDEFRDSLIIDYLSRKHLGLLNTSKTKINLVVDLVSNGKIKVLEKLMDRGVSIPDSFYSYNSPILFACFNGNYESFMFFVERGYKVNQETKDRSNALHFACLGGNEQIIRYLISKGVNKYRRNSCQFSDDRTQNIPTTPLLCLLKSDLKNPYLLSLFLDEKACKTDDYWYFLLFSGKQYYYGVDWENVYKATQILLENGISPNFSGDIFWTSFNDGQNSILWLGTITYDDSITLKFTKLLVQYGLKINYLRNNYSGYDDAIYNFEREQSNKCRDLYFMTYSYLNAICPYYVRWGKPKPKDQTVIPMKPCSEENNYDFYSNDENLPEINGF